MAKTILRERFNRPRVRREHYLNICEIEADVIVTATVLGFSATRILAEQPFSFDIETMPPKDTKKWEHMFGTAGGSDLKLAETYASAWNRKDKRWINKPRNVRLSQHLLIDKIETYLDYMEHIEEMQSFEDVLDALSMVLDLTPPLNGNLIKDSQSPQWYKGARITGRPGGATTSLGNRPGKELDGRYRLNREKMPLGRAGKIRGNQERDQPGGYYGRGAYTGMIDDPVFSHTYIQPTKRIVSADNTRWRDFANIHHGLISPKGHENINLSVDNKEGMGPFGVGDVNKMQRGGVVGYVHGMSWAMRECIKHGPWCTPYEMAVGDQTTKMASCFACTTYMYSAGFPPSSIHLGRGESWHPLPSEPAEPYRSIVNSMNSRWHADVYHYLSLGARLLKKANSNLSADHSSALKLLRTRLPKIPPNNVTEFGGNLFLDALTVHQSDWKRIKNTLKFYVKNATDEKNRLLS